MNKHIDIKRTPLGEAIDRLPQDIRVAIMDELTRLHIENYKLNKEISRYKKIVEKDTGCK